jgi:mRNA interferase MazF
VAYKPYEVVVVPFPFTDRKADRRRPALILSDDSKFNQPSGHVVLAMITSQKNPDWPLETTITSIRRTGLTAPSKVRMKLFTLDSRLIVKKIGTLTNRDKKAVENALQRLLGIEIEPPIPGAESE